MSGRLIVAICDNTFAPVDVERAIFAEIGADVRFGHALTEDAVIELASGASAILCDAAPISRRVMAALPTLRVVSEYGIGYDNIDATAATEFGIWVTNVPGFCTEEVADHALAMVLALLRRLPALDRLTRAGKWGAGSAGPIHRVSQHTLGVVGFGRIGQLVARRARALGMRVLAYSPTTAARDAAVIGAEAVTFDRLLAESDVVSLHAPANDATRRMMNAATFACMKRGAILINVGRGVLVDERALLDALASGQIRAAGLDVFDPEPPLTDSPLIGHEDILLTPHAAFYSEESLRDLQTNAARNALAVLRGERPPTPVNPDVASRLRA
ncbi:MAG: C-terminal binding protein [Chloroflexota bacterium]|nr:MAG: C-terminal binding protein [Chloroflexota bacterium]